MGSAGSGKTTLASLLEAEPFPIRKTPQLVYRPITLDSPSAYLESPWMRHHLIAAAQDASCVLMLVRSDKTRTVYPPGFAKVFRVPVFGIITRAESHPEGIGAAEKELSRAGIAEPYYQAELTCPDSECLRKLLEQLETYKEERRE